MPRLKMLIVELTERQRAAVVFIIIVLIGLCMLVYIMSNKDEILEPGKNGFLDNKSNFFGNTTVSDGKGSSESLETSAEIVRVSAENFGFNPEKVEVDRGERIKFILKSEKGVHSLTVKDLDVSTGKVPEGETGSFTVRFLREGTYEFESTVGNGSKRGMNGQIVVN